MYEVIVLGATFAASGIAHRYKEKCLVIERQPRAGYEFFGGESFNACGDLSVYPFLKESHTVFCAEICSVTQNEGYFICETHGVDGFRSYEAKYIIDTRCNSNMCMSKTYDMLIESSELPCFSNVTCEKTVGNNRYILHCSVPLSCGYSEARILIGKVVRSFSKSQRLILLAD